MYFEYYFWREFSLCVMFDLNDMFGYNWHYMNTGTWLDEKSVVTGSSDHSVRLWNINNSPHEVPPRMKKKKEESTKEVEVVVET